MTPWEKLEWLEKNAHNVHVETNGHRSYYETVAQRIESGAEDGLFEDDAADVKAECIKRNEMTIVQVYPITPIGFYRVGHYDMWKAIEIAYDCVIKEVGRPPSPT